MPRRLTTDPIPVHHMEPAVSDGIRIDFIDSDVNEQKDMKRLGVHRDDYYIFFLLQQGRLLMNIDFTETALEECCTGYVLPGQVHSYLAAAAIRGWMLAIDAERIDASLRERFESRIVRNQVVPLNDASDAITCLRLAGDLPAAGSRLRQSVRQHLVNAFIGYVATAFEAGARVSPEGRRRTAVIAGAFLQLIKNDVIRLRNPAAFAAQLAISTAYLNEAVKAETGFPASYWIQQEMALEAKRLLYYTDLSVKEIAVRLGFDDAAYFSRFFRRQADLTPLAFRSGHRESS